MKYGVIIIDGKQIGIGIFIAPMHIKRIKE